MRKYWIELRSSLWFFPLTLVLCAIAAGWGAVRLDVVLADKIKPWGWLSLLEAGAEGARGMLEAIASSMITVAGLTFSITIVTLSLASTQYTPRILRNFMRDRSNQLVLGTFVGIYAYCLVVLRTIRNGDEVGCFVPLLSVSFGVLLALVGIFVLIYFIHHIAASIQASSILESITKETLLAAQESFPEDLGKPARNQDAALARLETTNWKSVASPKTGYLQSVDETRLWNFARDEDVILKMEYHMGDFFAEGSPLILCSKELAADAKNKLLGLFVLGSFRSTEQDPAFGIRQIVDIALKALSPGVNDTTTAVSCLD